MDGRLDLKLKFLKAFPAEKLAFLDLSQAGRGHHKLFPVWKDFQKGRRRILPQTDGLRPAVIQLTKKPGFINGADREIKVCLNFAKHLKSTLVNAQRI